MARVSIERRLAALEANPANHDVQATLTGVASAPLPSDGLDDWAASLLSALGAPASCWLTVVDGERGMLVPFTPLRWLKGEPEQAWFAASRGDHVSIFTDGSNMIARRFENDAEVERWIRQLERELAQGESHEWAGGDAA